jgi:hypothetical protein
MRGLSPLSSPGMLATAAEAGARRHSPWEASPRSRGRRSRGGSGPDGIDAGTHPRECGHGPPGAVLALVAGTHGYSTSIVALPELLARLDPSE